MPQIGPTSREECIERLARETFDVCVVGGGITGAGIALDAASRGLSVALVERGDFASGTSSKSSKFVHGGLRYLANYDFGLSWEAAQERDLLRRLAPHVVRPVQFLWPAFRHGLEATLAPVGLTIYDLLSTGRGFRRHRRARPESIRRLAPTLRHDRVHAAWTYWDARADDARLVFEILRTAHGLGAAIANYSAVRGFDKARGRAAAALVEDIHGDRPIAVRAGSIVNAAGVWAGEVASLDDPALAPKLRPAKGIHLTVPAARLPLRSACIVPSISRDGRSVFAFPWGPVVGLGTTDTEYSGPLDSPAVGSDDAAYILSAVNTWFDTDLSPTDAIAGWAGLRPLLEGGAERTADLSRRHAITTSPSGVITITGGKLTTYRRMARDAVDLVCERLGVRARCCTARLPIGLAASPRALYEETRALAARLGLDPDVARHLVAAHGDRAPDVLALVAEDPTLGAPVAPPLPDLLAEIAFAFRAEMAVTLEDALARRTRLALQDSAGGLGDLEAVRRAAGLPRKRLQAEARVYAAALAAERGPVPPPPLAT
ncbi:MAG: glycerol-3-phosphate dehydrogenase/oxidase [Acidobacteria bacterium]|nr:glycerol-3-phosphate dehydrogenase/oxidase [Acidobacteriota bacterium]